MIEAKELRSGNYVLGNPLSIPRLGIYSNGVTKITSHGISEIEFGNINYDPLPITEEILIKAGFTIVKTTTAYGYDCNKYCEEVKYTLRGAWNGENWFAYEILNNGTHKKIEYVHQLQNLYFALTGEELKIKS